MVQTLGDEDVIRHNRKSPSEQRIWRLLAKKQTKKKAKMAKKQGKL